MIEVSHASRYDLAVKARLYASSGYPEYWVVDLVREVVVVHRDPADDVYISTERRCDGMIHPLRHPAVAIDVGQLLA